MCSLFCFDCKGDNDDDHNGTNRNDRACKGSSIALESVNPFTKIIPEETSKIANRIANNFRAEQRRGLGLGCDETINTN